MNVRLVVKDSKLSKDDYCVVIGAPYSVTVELPTLDKVVPEKEHGHIHEGNVLVLSAPRDGSSHKVVAAPGNHINITHKSYTLSAHQSVTFVSYGKNWFCA